MAVPDSAEPLSKKQIFTFSCWPPDDGLEQQKNAEELPKHHMAPWSSTAVLRAGTLWRKSCSAGQEAGSRATPRFSAHTEIYGLDLTLACWYQRYGMGGLCERLSPTPWMLVLLLRAWPEDRAGHLSSLVPLEGAIFSLPRPSSGPIVQPPRCPGVCLSSGSWFSLLS